MEHIKRPFTERIAGGHEKSGFMIEKEFLIFNKPIVSMSSNLWNPPTDVYETGDNIFVKIDISGIRKDNVNIAFKDNVLTVRGERCGDFKHSKTCFYQVEIRYGLFEKQIIIPKPVKGNDIQAKYTDGFLVIALPKVEQVLTGSRLSD
ncbi:MAG: Hsp20/alpha crystallin family protein [Candidatus Anammoxibacter sp.]